MISPLISIITACLNSSALIKRAFDCVKNQSYKNIDYIVIDGGSTDDTLHIIKKYEEKFKRKDISFRWVSEPDKGIFDAMNKGIEMASGDIIGILNSDDYYEHDSIKNVVNAYQKNPKSEIFYGFLRVLYENNELEVYRYNYEYYLLNLKTGVMAAVQHPTCFVKKNVYNRIGKFDLQYKNAADYDFLIRARMKQIKFFAIDTIISNFSKGGNFESCSEYVRFEERYRILFNNGLLTKAEYDKKKKYLKYKRYKEFKGKIAKKIFRY